MPAPRPDNSTLACSNTSVLQPARRRSRAANRPAMDPPAITAVRGTRLSTIYEFLISQGWVYGFIIVSWCGERHDLNHCSEDRARPARALERGAKRRIRTKSI